MSCKLPLNNSFKANCDPIHWGKIPSTDVNVKFAGEEAKDRLYEPKHQKKLVRVLTVVAYIFFVSLAAIMLSLYYVFIWNGHQKENSRFRTVVVPISSGCDNDDRRVEFPQQLPTFKYDDDLPTRATPENSTWFSNYLDINSEFDMIDKRSVFMKKLVERQEK